MKIIKLFLICSIFLMFNVPVKAGGIKISDFVVTFIGDNGDIIKTITVKNEILEKKENLERTVSFETVTSDDGSTVVIMKTDCISYSGKETGGADWTTSIECFNNKGQLLWKRDGSAVSTNGTEDYGRFKKNISSDGSRTVVVSGEGDESGTRVKKLCVIDKSGEEIFTIQNNDGLCVENTMITRNGKYIMSSCGCYFFYEIDSAKKDRFCPGADMKVTDAVIGESGKYVINGYEFGKQKKRNLFRGSF